MEQESVCRTCLADSVRLFEVFGETGLELSLPHKLQEHLKITVDQTDECAVMCEKCISVLNEFHHMFTLAQEVQSHFAGHIRLAALVAVSDVKDESEIIVSDDHNPEFLQLIEGEYEGPPSEPPLEEVIIEETIEEVEDEDEGRPSSNITEEADVEYVQEAMGSDEEYEDEIVTEEEEEETSDMEGPEAPGRRQMRPIVSPEQRELDNELIRQTVSLLCTDCGQSYDTLEDLLMHYRHVHKKDAALICCDREFRARNKLLNHVKLHIDPTAFACDICEKRFGSKYTLNNHMATHVPEDECQFACEKCPKRFSTKARLTSHQKTHSDSSFVCSICSKVFSQKSTLVSHIRGVHERPSNAFVCDICTKSFKTKEAFVTHQANHMEVPPPRIACGICGKKMKNRDTLNQHLLRHKRANDRHYCDICGKEFNCKKRLGQHKKYVHATQKLQCELCDKTFKRPIYLKEHMALHTGTALYTCAFCPRQFNSNANKYSHQKAQHPQEWEEARQKRLEE